MFSHLLSALLASANPALSPVSPIASNSAATIDQRSRMDVVETIAELAEDRYVDAAGGAKIAARLRGQLASGAYAAMSDPASFADALTRDMRSAVPDVHLRAIHEPNRAERAPARRMVAAGAGGPAPYARIDSRSTAQIAATNFGFAAVERLDGNVGYLKLSRLVPLELSRDAAAAAMRALEGSDAVIIDLRSVPGGSPDLVVRLLSHFVGSSPVRLMTTYNRALDQTEELWTERETGGGPLAGVPLFVLQDGKSASAAEMLSYFVQRHRLGVVVGETSAGAGHGGNMIPVGADIALFLPQMRITDGPGWEGVGVKPDIPTAGGEGLSVALAKAVQAANARKHSG